MQKKKELISVIVPVYNVEKYLVQCLDSIINQTYPSLEVVLVDDGSKDNSGNICDEYKKNHPEKNIVVIHKKNGGLSSARNAGINVAAGAMYAFVDSDDFIKKDMIEILASDMKNNNADISCCEYIKVDESGNNFDMEKTETMETTITVVQGKKVLYSLYDNFSAWNKLYRKKLFENIQFPEGKLYEDARTTYRLAAITNRVTFNSRKLYCYRQRSASIMSSFSTKNYIDRVNVWNEIIEFMQDRVDKDELETMFIKKNKLVLELVACIFQSGKIIENRKILKKLGENLNRDSLKISREEYSSQNRIIAKAVHFFGRD